MCTLISKKFRPEHRDIEVSFSDDFGIEKKLYIGLAIPGVDVEARIAAHFAEEDQLAEHVRLALNPPPPVAAPLQAPKVAKGKKANK